MDRPFLMENSDGSRSQSRSAHGLRVAVIGSPWVPVPPTAYGGTEAVLDGLINGLLSAGHEVAYAGHADSRVAAQPLGSLDPDDVGPIGHTPTELAHVLAAYEQASAWDADVIHDHTMLGATCVRSAIPVVVTNHGPFDSLTTPVFEHIARHAAVVAISRAQASSCRTVPITAIVHHGLDVSSWPMGAGGEYLLFLGRMNPDKGPHRAIALAREAGVPLVLAAKMREEAERQFFDAEVRPRLHPDAHFVGEADATTKRSLLAGAKALLNPIEWPEPFGMVMIESLACGTPVICPPHGAAPEIVDHGVTGYLVDSTTAALEAIDAVETLDRAACRDAVVERFTIDAMVDRYIDVYQAVRRPRLELVASNSAIATGGGGS